MHTHAHGPTPRHAQPSRKAIKQLTERLRRDQRELARDLQERVGRGCYPVREDGPAPRID
jgi:hypothetical protein